MLTPILFALIALGVSVFVALPLLQSRSGRIRHASDAGNHRAIDLEERKKSVYGAIKEIDFDYQMGKLSDEDYQELRQRYKDEAIGLLKEIDKTMGFSKKGGKGAKGKSRKGQSENPNFCWLCGNKIMPDDRFCPNCGHEMGEMTS